MDQITTFPGASLDPSAERRARILDAAERCFVRTGFHRATMQDVAAEAGMSPGNLYRYFKSKSTLVAGLAERDRTAMASDFNHLEDAPNFAAAFAELGRRHFAEEPRERAILTLEIWAEATRNPDLAALTNEFEREVVGRITHLLEVAQERDAVKTREDPRTIALLICTLADGLFVRRAIAPGFDPEREVSNIMKVIGALLDGTIDLSANEKSSGALR
jgi:TetR/AcrR family transcriptional regulator, repressor for uid operon